MSQQIRAVAMGAIAALGSVMAQAQSPQAVVYNVTATGQHLSIRRPHRTAPHR